MTKKKTGKKTSAKRKVFLKALKVIEQSGFPDRGNIFELAKQLLPLLAEAPKSGWLAEQSAICSALWATEHKQFLSADEVDENCLGAGLFLVAYQLGRMSAIEAARKKRS